MEANTIEVNTIKEIFKGHYQVILDFLEPNDLKKIIDQSYKYIWGINHIENAVSWTKYQHTLYGTNAKDVNAQARNISMEFLLKTEDFTRIIPSIHQTVTISKPT